MINYKPYFLSKQFSFVCTLAAFIVVFDGKTSAATIDYSPPFKETRFYSTTISANKDLADIYYPKPSDINSGKYSFPIVLLWQGALVDKSFYSDYASLVARYGFVVVVPNHFRPLPINPNSPPSLLSETSQIGAVLSQMAIENTKTTSPISSVVDTQRLGLLGHYFGGAVGLSVIGNNCLPELYLCQEPFTRPKELLAGGFFGANLRNPISKEFVPIANDGIPVALIQGDIDGVALPERAQSTFDKIQTPPKTLITVTGANHFGLTDVNNPAGANPDLNTPTLEPAFGIETIARWSALFLRANMLKDRAAFDYIYSQGDGVDPNVSLTSVGVPETSSMAGLAMFGIVGLGYRWRKRKATLAGSK
ncbi:poly(ethylene terephthalate) hydrolase family protein [Microcoleus sp. MON2_D5]|uniref:poly(ethylene terephthalate) hydrolase family protein n=1 Tax=Microcoleus sp. MON2_D5 TaxID=2818833 RepID=UPI002FCFA809